MAYFERALSIRPDYVEACNNLANSLVRLGRTADAIAMFERALSFKADAQVHFNLANVLLSQGRTDRAVEHLEKALSIAPDFAEAHNNLGNLTRRSRGLLQAIRHFRQALSAKPDFAEAHNNLGSALQARGSIDEAIQHFERALALRPGFTAAHNNLLFALNYVEGRAPSEIFEAHREFARQREMPLTVPADPRGPESGRDRRIRIGYVSSDFRHHSVSHFIEPVLEHHDRDRFEIFCYYNLSQADEVTHRLRSKVEHWRVISTMTDAAAEATIRNDRIDILVDLNGHTTKNRLLLFCRKPAPIQVTWLGYPNTTGLSSIDYRLTDGFADPVGETDRFHSERLIRLPECFSCYSPPPEAPAVSPLPALSRDHVTFGSFNKFAKITSEVLKVWADILRAVPRSRLMLKTSALIEDAMRREVSDRFVAYGVDPGRLDLLGPDASQQAHLARYHDLDIGLDPFPYNGTTTTCEALWMGVPVVTLAGQAHAGRVGVSQMTNLGLPELIAGSHGDYVAIARRLAEDLDALASLRRGLRMCFAASPLMAHERFTRNLERAYLEIRGEGMREPGRVL